MAKGRMTSRYEARVAAAVIPGILALALLLSTGEAAASFAVGERPTPTPLGGGLLDHGAVPIAADLPATTRTIADGG